MIYSYQQKNKFKHLLLDPNIIRIENGYPSTIQYYRDKKKWIKESIGQHNVEWTVNYGFHYKGEKIYQKNVCWPTFRDSNGWQETEYSIQWCFLNKDDALAFKLRWS